MPSLYSLKGVYNQQNAAMSPKKIVSISKLMKSETFNYKATSFEHKNPVI